MIKIDKNIPMPDSLRGGSAKYPWRAMAVGDSFFVAGKRRNMLSSAASSFARRNGFKFAMRLATENGAAGVRVWRTA